MVSAPLRSKEFQSPTWRQDTALALRTLFQKAEFWHRTGSGRRLGVLHGSLVEAASGRECHVASLTPGAFVGAWFWIDNDYLKPLTGQAITLDLAAEARYAPLHPPHSALDVGWMTHRGDVANDGAIGALSDTFLVTTLSSKTDRLMASRYCIPSFASAASSRSQHSRNFPRFASRPRTRHR